MTKFIGWSGKKPTHRLEKFIVCLILAPVLTIVLAVVAVVVIIIAIGVLLLPVFALVAPDSIKFE